MTNAINATKSAFTWAVVTLTILWSVGVSALAPLAVQAAEFEPGDLISPNNDSAVFLINNDMERVYFANGRDFASYLGLGAVTQVEPSVLADFPTGGGITISYGPIQDQYSRDVYFMTLDGETYRLASEAAANALLPGWFGLRAVIGGPFVQDYPDSLRSASMGDADGMSILPNSIVFYADKYWVEKDGGLYEIEGTLSEFFIARATPATAEMIEGFDVMSGTMPAASIVDATMRASMGASSGSGNSGDGNSSATAGDLSVSLSAATPAGRNIASGSAFNEVLKVSVTATGGRVEVDGLTLTKGGFVGNTNISGVELLDGSMNRLGNVASSISTDDEVVMSFPTISLAAGESETLTVRVNVTSAAQSGSLVFSVNSADAVEANGDVAGSFPVTGNTFYFIDASSAIASVTADVKSVYGASGTTLNVNEDSSQDITKFEFAETSSNEDVELVRLRLTNQGSADDADYQDVQLVAPNGTVLATAQPMGDEVLFDLSASPFLIEEGNSDNFEVRATIVDGSTKTIHLTIEDDYDVEIRGKSTGAYILADVGATDTAFPIGDAAGSGSGNYNKVTIGSGSLTFSKDANSPSAAVAPGTDSVELARFIARPTGEDYELRRVELAIATSSAKLLTGSVTIKVNGKTVYSGAASGISTVSGSATSITLSSYPRLESGEDNTISVFGNVDDDATASDSYKVYLDLTQAKKLISNTTADPSVAQASGNTINVDDASLVVTTLSTPVAQSTVAGVDEFHFATFELNTGGSGAPVRVSSITVVDVLGAGSDFSGVNNLRLYRDGQIVPTSNSTATNASTSTFTFVDAIVIQPDQAVQLMLKGNVVSNTGTSHTFDTTGVNATNNTTGEDVSETVAGSGQTMTVAGAGSVALSLVSGTNGTPTTAQVVPVGTTDGTYFSFKLTALNEGAKLRSLKVTATGTVNGDLVANDLSNIRLYSSLDNYTSPVAVAAQLSCATGATCTYTWTASDNLLSSPIMPGTPVTFRVKADINGAGSADLGNNFAFRIASTTADMTLVGASTGSTITSISGSATGSSFTHIVPFNVSVAATSPASSQTLGTGSGVVVGVYKVTNSGSSAATLSQLGFTNNGSATTTYSIFASADGGAQSDTTVTVTSSMPNANLDTVAASLTINGGSHRYITVKTASSAENNSNTDLGVTALGSFLFSVSEADLGYSGNPSSDADLGDTVSSLYIDGKPSTASVTHSSN